MNEDVFEKNLILNFLCLFFINCFRHIFQLYDTIFSSIVIKLEYGYIYFHLSLRYVINSLIFSNLLLIFIFGVITCSLYLDIEKTLLIFLY